MHTLSYLGQKVHDILRHYELMNKSKLNDNDKIKYEEKRKEKEKNKYHQTIKRNKDDILKLAQLSVNIIN